MINNDYGHSTRRRLATPENNPTRVSYFQRHRSHGLSLRADIKRMFSHRRSCSDTSNNSAPNHQESERSRSPSTGPARVLGRARFLSASLTSQRNSKNAGKRRSNSYGSEAAPPHNEVRSQVTARRINMASSDPAPPSGRNLKHKDASSDDKNTDSVIRGESLFRGEGSDGDGYSSRISNLNSEGSEYGSEDTVHNTSPESGHVTPPISNTTTNPTEDLNTGEPDADTNTEKDRKIRCYPSDDEETSSESFDINLGPLRGSPPSLHLKPSDTAWFLAVGTESRSTAPSFVLAFSVISVPGMLPVFSHRTSSVLLMISGSIFRGLGGLVSRGLVVFFETIGNPSLCVSFGMFLSFALPEIKTRRFVISLRNSKPIGWYLWKVSSG